MAERKWLPEHLADEVSPASRPSPNDWIVAGDVDAAWLSAGDEETMDNEDIIHSRKVVCVDSIVDFHWFEDYGAIAVMIRPDGSFTPQEPVPAGATHFAACGDPESLAMSIEDFARQYAENEADILPELISVHCYAWSDEPVPHRLVRTVEGLLRFEAVETGHG